MRPELAMFIHEQRIHALEWKKTMEAHERETEQLRSQFRTQIEPYIRKASAKDYMKWLEGYLNNGNKPTHYYDYPMPTKFYVAKRDFESMHLCGSLAIEVIVPKGINIDTSETGHCNFYLMDDFSVIGHWVPVYNNTII